MSEPNLYTINLPAGNQQGFDIDFRQDQRRTHYDSSLWKNAGYDGVRFVGAGKHATHLLPSPYYMDSTVFIGPHDGIVQFEKLTIHNSNRKVLHAGLENHGPGIKQLEIRMRNVHIESDHPAPGSTAQNSDVWALFGYQCDWDLERVSINHKYGAEHALYVHGVAKKGVRWKNVTVIATGAEGLKVTARPHECLWVKDAVIDVQDCYITDWNQDWSWRGGAGIVVQGSSMNLNVERTYVIGIRDYNHSRGIMIDDSGYDHYDANTGTPAGPGVTTVANGNIRIFQTAVIGKPGVSWYSNLIHMQSLTQNNPNPLCAKSFTVDTCGVYGDHQSLSLSRNNVAGLIRIANCNTPSIQAFLQGQGYDVSVEASILGLGPLVPVSHGFTA